MQQLIDLNCHSQIIKTTTQSYVLHRNYG